MMHEAFAANNLNAVIEYAVTPPNTTNRKTRTPRTLTGRTKLCGGCSEVKDLSEFVVKRNSHASNCRACQKVLSDASYVRNKTKRVAAAGVRNLVLREKLAKMRDDYLDTHCVCEACSSTVDLQLTSRAGYTGPSVHQILGGALTVKRLTAALEGSQVLCRPCMGSTFGKKGGMTKALNLAERLKAKQKIEAAPIAG